MANASIIVLCMRSSHDSAMNRSQCRRLSLRTESVSPPIPRIPAHPLARTYKTYLLTLFSCQAGLSARKSVFITMRFSRMAIEYIAADGCPADWTDLPVLRKRHAA